MLVVFAVITVTATILSLIMTLVARKNGDSEYKLFAIGTLVIFVLSIVLLDMCATVITDIAMPVLSIILAIGMFQLHNKEGKTWAIIYLTATIILLIVILITSFNDGSGPTEMMMCKHNVKGQIMPNQGFCYFETNDGDTIIMLVRNGRAQYLGKYKSLR